MRSLPPLADDALALIVERVREHEPDAGAVLATGSYAKGTARADSDLDLTAITRAPERTRYRMWFEDGLHVSVSAKTTGAWLAALDQPHAWTLGFPGTYDAVYVWAEDDVRERLGEPPSNAVPPSDPEVEDFVEASLKARRGGVALRVHARSAGELAPGILRKLNPDRIVHDRLDAVAAALALPVAPAGWRDDLSICLGLVPAADSVLALASLRLARGVLALVREHDPTVDPQPDVAQYVADGTFERLFD